jgi:hypothetical protein
MREHRVRVLLAQKSLRHLRAAALAVGPPLAVGLRSSDRLTALVCRCPLSPLLSGLPGSPCSSSCSSPCPPLRRPAGLLRPGAEHARAHCNRTPRDGANTALRVSFPFRLGLCICPIRLVRASQTARDAEVGRRQLGQAEAQSPLACPLSSVHAAASPDTHRTAWGRRRPARTRISTSQTHTPTTATADADTDRCNVGEWNGQANTARTRRADAAAPLARHSCCHGVPSGRPVQLLLLRALRNRRTAQSRHALLRQAFSSVYCDAEIRSRCRPLRCRHARACFHSARSWCC